MRTLDEVIKAVEEDLECANVSYPETFYDYDNHKDALYYLKEYRSDMQMYAANQKHWEDELAQKIKDFGDAKDRYIARLKELDIGTLNEPLTWDELKTMEGKPVWIVPEEEKGYWFVIEFFNNNPYYGGDRVIFTNDVVLNRCNLGKTWQAYRKERTGGGDQGDSAKKGQSRKGRK